MAQQEKIPSKKWNWAIAVGVGVFLVSSLICILLLPFRSELFWLGIVLAGSTGFLAWLATAQYAINSNLNIGVRFLLVIFGLILPVIIVLYNIYFTKPADAPQGSKIRGDTSKTASPKAQVPVSKDDLIAKVLREPLANGWETLQVIDFPEEGRDRSLNFEVSFNPRKGSKLTNVSFLLCEGIQGSITSTGKDLGAQSILIQRSLHAKAYQLCINNVSASISLTTDDDRLALHPDPQYAIPTPVTLNVTLQPRKGQQFTWIHLEKMVTTKEDLGPLPGFKTLDGKPDLTPTHLFVATIPIRLKGYRPLKAALELELLQLNSAGEPFPLKTLRDIATKTPELTPEVVLVSVRDGEIVTSRKSFTSNYRLRWNESDLHDDEYKVFIRCPAEARLRMAVRSER